MYKKVFVKLPSENDGRLEKVKGILRGKDGSIPVILYFEDTRVQLGAPKSMWISSSDDIKALQYIAGDENVKGV